MDLERQNGTDCTKIRMTRKTTLVTSKPTPRMSLLRKSQSKFNSNNEGTSRGYDCGDSEFEEHMENYQSRLDMHQDQSGMNCGFNNEVPRSSQYKRKQSTDQRL